MKSVDYIKEQNTILDFYLKALLVLVVAFLLGYSTININKEIKTIKPLSANQQQKLIEQLSYQGFKETLKNNCYGVLVERIQNKTWSDSWCADKYKHLNLNGE